MLNFEISATINAVSALKSLTSGYLLGELDRQAFENQRRRLLSGLSPVSSSLALAHYLGEFDVDEADEFAEDYDDDNELDEINETGQLRLAA